MNLSKAIGHNNDNYKYSFICCVEAGRLEYQTCLMISTFRKNAGEILKNSPLYVVSGRSGSRLSNQTMEFFLKNNVHYVKAHKNNPKSWFNYSNKVAAVSWAQENLKSEFELRQKKNLSLNSIRVDWELDIKTSCHSIETWLKRIRM